MDKVKEQFDGAKKAYDAGDVGGATLAAISRFSFIGKNG